MENMDNLDSLKSSSFELINKCSNLKSLEEIRVKLLGKKGEITSKLQQLGKIEADKRKEFGQAINSIKTQVAKSIEAKKTLLEEEALNKKLLDEKIDITLPIREKNIGKFHPITRTIDECIDILSRQGFSVKFGPEIEDDFHNFTALNIPKNHPARQMQDTFYIPAEDEDEKLVLRTHTSSVQIREMLNNKPPFKFIAPGRVYRSDYDITHTPMFHQIEGLYIDKEINMGHLKGCLNQFLKEFFELDDFPLRFRPSFFPFTEPSAEVDIGCTRNNGELKIGEGDDWLEILGCGMVHPNVLENVNIDPEEYQGFAFGVGIERLAMLKYGIPDLRDFFSSDASWLKHYGFNSL